MARKCLHRLSAGHPSSQRTCRHLCSATREGAAAKPRMRAVSAIAAARAVPVCGLTAWFWRAAERGAGGEAAATHLPRVRQPLRQRPCRERPRDAAHGHAHGDSRAGQGAAQQVIKQHRALNYWRCAGVVHATCMLPARHAGMRTQRCLLCRYCAPQPWPVPDTVWDATRKSRC